MNRNKLQQNSFDLNPQDLDWYTTKSDTFNTGKKALQGNAQATRHIGYVSPYRAAYFRAFVQVVEQSL